MAYRYAKEEREEAERQQALMAEQPMHDDAQLYNPQQAPAAPMGQAAPTYPVQQSHNHMAALVSAPVSRSADSFAHSPPQLRPETMRLTPLQAEMCRKASSMFNLSPQEYAEQLLKMEARKKAGDLQL
jgi:hypothetical protein